MRSDTYSMLQQGSGNVPFAAFASETNLFQQLNQNQMGETIGFPGIGGIFKGAFADGSYLRPPNEVSI